jgi:hypothetical protein
MSKIVPAYRLAPANEINKCRSVREALANQAGREALDEMIKMCKNNCCGNGASGSYIAMSIFMAQTKKRQELESLLNKFLWQKTCQTTENQKHENSREHKLESKNPN